MNVDKDTLEKAQDTGSWQEWDDYDLNKSNEFVDLIKAKKNTSKLVPVQRQISRAGKTFQQTVWVNPRHAKSSKKDTIKVPKWDFNSGAEFNNEFQRINKMTDKTARQHLKNELLNHVEKDLGVTYDKVPESDERANVKNMLRGFSAAKKALDTGTVSKPTKAKDSGKRKESSVPREQTKRMSPPDSGGKPNFNSAAHLDKEVDKLIGHKHAEMFLDTRDAALIDSVTRFARAMRDANGSAIENWESNSVIRKIDAEIVGRKLDGQKGAKDALDAFGVLDTAIRGNQFDPDEFADQIESKYVEDGLRRQFGMDGPLSVSEYDNKVIAEVSENVKKIVRGIRGIKMGS